MDPNQPSKWCLQGRKIQSCMMPAKIETPTWTLAHIIFLMIWTWQNPNFFLTKASDLAKQILAWCSPFFSFTRTWFRSQCKHKNWPWNQSSVFLSDTTIKMFWIHSAFRNCGHSRDASQHHFFLRNAKMHQDRHHQWELSLFLNI